MRRLSIATSGRAQEVIEGLCRDVKHRISTSSPGLCPVDMALSFLCLVPRADLRQMSRWTASTAEEADTCGAI
nr:hypothetical protein [uncultured Agathobaculum sp.]